MTHIEIYRTMEVLIVLIYHNFKIPQYLMQSHALYFVMVVCDSSSHDKLTGGTEGSPGIQDALPPQLPQNHV